tara:strand:- start:2499 stop:2774 length:276 start_codon:yes stop_codon:yes gene_type:complete
MATKQHALFQITSFVDDGSIATFCDGTKATRNPRCGQWVRLDWMTSRSRFIGVSRSGILVMDHNRLNNQEFSDKVQAFKRANDPQCRFPWG